MNKLHKSNLYHKGFTLIEVLIVLAILVLVTSIIAPSFVKLGGGEALDTSVSSIISILNEAKSEAVSSKNASDYGVRILKNQLVSFENSYGTNNKTLTISSLVSISTSTGMATNSEVIFSNVSGSSNASGTITVTVLRDPTKKSTITVYSTGAIEKN